MQYTSRSASSFALVLRFQQCIAIGLVMGAAAALALFPSAVQAQQPTPNGFTQQGFVTDNNGNPLNGDVQMTFFLSRSSDPADPILYEETLAVDAQEGRYTARLGMEEGVPSTNWLPDEVFWPGSMWVPSTKWHRGSTWLHTQVEGETLSP